MMTEMIAQPTAKSAWRSSGNAKRGSNHSVNFSMPGRVQQADEDRERAQHPERTGDESVALVRLAVVARRASSRTCWPHVGEVVLDEFVALDVRDVGVGFAVVPPRYSPKNVRYTQRVMYAAVMNAPTRPTIRNSWKPFSFAFTRISSFDQNPANGKMPHERDRADDERPERLRHVLPQAAHVLLHVEGVVRARVAHRAGAEEEVGLEERVGEEVEDRRDPRADAERHDHVAELADRRVGEDLLDVVLDERERGTDDHRDPADRGHRG